MPRGRGAFCWLVLAHREPAHLSRVPWVPISQTPWGAPRVVHMMFPVSWACCHLFSWLRGRSLPLGPLSFAGPRAAGMEQTGVAGGRGFIFSPTASVTLSLWRCWAGAPHAPASSSGSPGSPAFSVETCRCVCVCVCAHACVCVHAGQRDRDVPCDLGHGCFASLACLRFLT